MKQSESRREDITKFILTNEKATVEELAERYSVTRETIRSDLTFLEMRGIIYRTHGGATIRNNISELPLEIRVQDQSTAKKQIAYEAINYIEDGMVLFIDSSSTSLPLVRLLRMKKNITIVTNFLEIIPHIAGTHNKVVLTGGEYWQRGNRLSGNTVVDFIDGMHFDMAIIGMEGCAGMTGPCENLLDTRALNRHAMKHSSKTMLIADHTKFDRTSNYLVCDFEDIDILITDYIDKKYLSGIKPKELVMADKSE